MNDYPDNKTRAQFMQELTTCWQTIKQLEDDNKRLRLEARQASASWNDDKRADAAEIERLRADYALLSDDYKQLLGDVERLRQSAETKEALLQEKRAEIERLRGELEDQRKDTVCDEQRIADLMADVQRQGLEIERLRTDYALLSDDYKQLLGDVERLRGVIDRAAKAWLSLEPGVAWEGDVGGAMKAAVAEIERLRGIVGLESDDLDLDWDRLRSGDQRALIADHQDVFNMMFDLQAEIERLRGLLRIDEDETSA